MKWLQLIFRSAFYHYNSQKLLKFFYTNIQNTHGRGRPTSANQYISNTFARCSSTPIYSCITNSCNEDFPSSFALRYIGISLHWTIYKTSQCYLRNDCTANSWFYKQLTTNNHKMKLSSCFKTMFVNLMLAGGFLSREKWYKSISTSANSCQHLSCCHAYSERQPVSDTDAHCIRQIFAEEYEESPIFIDQSKNSATTRDHHSRCQVSWANRDTTCCQATSNKTHGLRRNCDEWYLFPDSIYDVHDQSINDRWCLVVQPLSAYAVVQLVPITSQCSGLTCKQNKINAIISCYVLPYCF